MWKIMFIPYRPYNRITNKKCKEVEPRTAKLALSIRPKLKMVE